jgi:hypothetical protein
VLSLVIIIGFLFNFNRNTSIPAILLFQFPRWLQSFDCIKTNDEKLFQHHLMKLWELAAGLQLQFCLDAVDQTDFHLSNG